MLCSKLHCQKGFKLKPFFYKIQRLKESNPFLPSPDLPRGRSVDRRQLSHLRQLSHGNRAGKGSKVVGGPAMVRAPGGESRTSGRPRFGTPPQE